MAELKTHLRNAVTEGEPNHIDILEMEEWDLSATDEPVD
jgi:hypothetical protein